jgi:site-specific recombinase XerC
VRSCDEVRCGPATRRAGIAKNVGPHTLRHAFITRLDARVPLRDVQEAASHADPRATMRYDKAQELHQASEIREVCPRTKGRNEMTVPELCDLGFYEGEPV